MLPAGPVTPKAWMLLKWLLRPLPFLEEAARAHGDTFTVRLGVAPPFVIFSDPAAVKDIFTGDPNALHAGQANVILRSVLGESSILVLDGARHLRERKLLLPPFHGERMRAYGAAIHEITAARVARWPVGRPFPLHPELQAITLDVILRAVFGFDSGAHFDEMRAAIMRWTELGTSRLGTALLLLTPVHLVDRYRATAEARLFGLPVGRLSPWSPLVRAQAAMRGLLRAQIARRRAAGVDGRVDILSMLLGARDEEGQPFTEEQLVDEMLTLLVAGHETTATASAWTVSLLLDHPAELARVHAKLAAGDATPERLAGLEWLDASIKEALRLRPVVPMVGRVLSQPQRIGGRDLPAGVVALASIYLAHRRAESWPDPLRFDPARFAGKKLDPYQWFPFGGGTRRCLGMAFALYEMKVVLGTILSRVSLSAAAGPPIRVVRRGITFAPSGGMRVIAA